MTNKAKLPCFPCPHAAACCAYGAELKPEEAARIAARFGADKIVPSRQPGEEGVMRTAINPGWGCIFLTPESTCAIHAEPEYPSVCAGFPDTDGYGEPYTDTKDICPELYYEKLKAQREGK